MSIEKIITNSKKFLLLILSIFLFNTSVYSQESKSIHKNYIGLSLTEQLFVDFRVSYERKMCCGLGKCGHCRMDTTYICTDGPVFNYAFGKTLYD